ncbi:MAG: hypothetical protein K8R02_01100 [Anaerohalosphaeraceae bacterium]|nr:hypothetical protein [Anaerohalosphaeraceae bacterium]
MKKYFAIVTVMSILVAMNCYAVTSKIVEHKSAAEMADGEKDNVVINSRGTLQLAGQTKLLSEDFGNAWAASTMVYSDDGSIYIGTSPNGEIFKYKNGNTEKIYPIEKAALPDDANGLDEKYMTNTHIFKMITDSTGKLIVAVSGEKCELLRYNGKKFETIFEPNDANYIFAMTLDKAGNIYTGTGPQGKFYRLDRKSGEGELIYDCQDKNILSLTTSKDGFLYAGTDTRGLVYKIDPKNKSAVILYDSSENEISDLMFDSHGNLYAAATSYKAIKAQLSGEKHVAETPPGKPELPEALDSTSGANSVQSLKIANPGNSDDDKSEKPAPPAAMKRGTPGQNESIIYKIDKDGFVDTIFSQTAVFFCLAEQDNQLLLGTGNNAQLYSVDPATEIQTLIYEDKTASQITDIITIGDTSYFCTANPIKLIELSGNFAKQGNFISPLIDASQPASWGKLQIDAEIPGGAKIMLSARTGNTEDANDPTYSEWTKPVKISEPVELEVPLGRFCQYKLLLSGNGKVTPIIRQTATAFVIPNLKPKVTSVKTDSGKGDDSAMIKIIFAAEDSNADKLVYKIDFRKAGRKGWIKLKDKLEENSFSWPSGTVEDGLYEIRVTASDEPSNSEATALASSRISEPFTVDNTAPAIEKHQIKIAKDTCTAEFKIRDMFSVVKNLSYTVDSNEDWKSALPADGIYDTTQENITIALTELDPGSHVLAVRVSDAAENMIYKTFEFEIK